MTILITGAAGFIGSHVAERLLTDGHRGVVVDNFTGFYPEEVKRRNFAEIAQTASALGRPADLVLEEADICDEHAMAEVFERHRPDAVIHLAAHAGVRPSIEHAPLYHQVNIMGTVTLLECMKQTSCKKLVFASSSSVYGNNEKVPFSEDDPVDHPISPYAATKKAGELICHTYHHLFGFNVACLRFFTVYGPRQRPDLAIHKFARLMMEGREIPFFGDGSTRRDYTFIGDIVDGVCRALEWTQADEKRFDVFNLGESQTISLDEMVKTIGDALGIEPKLNRLPAQPGDVMQTYADISKSKKILGYHPHTSFPDGVKVFVQWLRQQG